MGKKEELHGCNPIVMQPATSKENNATGSATQDATIDLKALALKGLQRNRHCNQAGINPENKCNYTPLKTNQKLHISCSKITPQKANDHGCDGCKHKEIIVCAGDGCVYKTEGTYKDIWTLIDKLDECPRGYWN